MGFNWKAAFGGAASAVGQTAGLLITDEVSKMREARMAKYQQAQVADERQYQGTVRAEDHTRNLEMMGIKGEQEAAQAMTEREQELADMTRKEQHEMSKIRLQNEGGPETAVTVNTGQNLDARTEEFSKAIGKADAEMYSGVRTAAQSAIQMEDSLNVLEEMQSKFETGKTQEALAILGQYAGTDAGAAMQAWEGTISPIVLAKAESLSGVLSDKDMEFLKASVPQFGLDKKANSIMIGLMRKGMQRAIENERSMQEHLNEHGNLNNWQAPNKQGSQINASVNSQTNIGAADDPLGFFD